MCLLTNNRGSSERACGSLFSPTSNGTQDEQAGGRRRLPIELDSVAARNRVRGCMSAGSPEQQQQQTLKEILEACRALGAERLQRLSAHVEASC